ncbi:ankyrin repeat-containing domain protein, partial [Tuber borchii]
DVNPDSSDEYGRTPLSYAAGSGHEGVVKMLLERADVSPNSPDKYGRTPLSHAAKSGHEGVGILLGRVDVKLGSSGVCGQTPLLLAAGPGCTGLVKPLSEPRPFRRQASPNSDVSQQISAPAVRAPEKVELVLVSRQEGIISDIRHQSSLNQLQVAPSSSVLRPTLTPNTTPEPAITQPPMRPKRDQSAPPPLRRSKRKRLLVS